MAAKDIEAGRAYVLLSIRDKITQGLKLAEKRLQQFGRYASTTGAVISGGAFAALAWPVKLSADMEQASVSMEVFLGSASAAKQLISEIELMAAKTPFRFDELKDAANLLLGFGATGNQIIPMLRLLGDASRGNAESFARLSLAFGQTMAKGRLMGQEVLQMTEQGFNPLYWISKQTGRSMETLMKEMEAGQISFSMLVQAFQTATGPMGKFNGMMDKQSQTLTGLTSSFLDFFAMLARSVGDALVPTLKSVISTANSVAVGLTAMVKANSGLVASIAKTVLIVGAIGAAIVGVGIAAMALSFVVGLVASGFAAMASIIMAPIALIGTVMGAVASMGTAIVGLITSIPAALAAIFSPFGLLVALFVGAGVAALYYYDVVGEVFRGFGAMIGPAVGSLSEFAAGFNRVFEAAGSAVTGIVNALSTGDIQLAGAIALGALKSMFLQALVEIPGMGKMLSTGFGQALLAGRWDLMFEIGMTSVKLKILEGWNAIANIWSATLTGLGAMWDLAIYGIRTGWNTASTFLASGMLWVVGALRTGIVQIQNLFDALVTQAKVAALHIKGFFSGTSEETSAQAAKLAAEAKARMGRRMSQASGQNRGEQQMLAEDAKRTQQGINADLNRSMTGRVASEQAARAARAGQENQLKSRIADLNSQASKAASDAGVSNLNDAAFKARYELAAMTDAARAGAEKRGADAASRIVPGVAGGTGLPKVETRGSFTAAGALALSNRSNAQEATARNTALANKLLRTIADKRGPQFS